MEDKLEYSSNCVILVLLKTIEHIGKSITDKVDFNKVDYMTKNENTVVKYENDDDDDDTSLRTSNTIGQGTNKYMAPEVWDGKYNTKADVYSLAIVGQQIFDLDNNLIRSDKLKQQFEIINDVLEEMKNIKYNIRPSCSEILNKKDNWCLNYIPIT